jgi:hypothetical protein
LLLVRLRFGLDFAFESVRLLHFGDMVLGRCKRVRTSISLANSTLVERLVLQCRLTVRERLEMNKERMFELVCDLLRCTQGNPATSTRAALLLADQP